MMHRMFTHNFRFNTESLRNGTLFNGMFQAGVRKAFQPRKPRHPLVRATLGVAGLVVLAVLVTFSVFLGAAMLAGGLIYRLVRGDRRPIARDSAVVDAEYRVVDRDALPPR